MGEALTSADPLLARRLGLATVYQDDSLVRELTVAENLLLGAVERSASLRGARAWAAALLAPYDLDISPDAFVGSLNPAQRQFLEIVKALAANPSVLLLDEPTSTLDFSGVEKLSGIVEQIAAAGAAVVYVSHRLPEILALADRVTILRDGEGQGTYDVGGDLSENDLIALMIGRAIESGYPPRGRRAGRRRRPVGGGVQRPAFSRYRLASPVVARSSVSPARKATASARRCARSAGSSKQAARCCAKARPVRSGGPRDALGAGILSLSADRANESIFPTLGLRENMTVQALRRFCLWWVDFGARPSARGRARWSISSISSPRRSTSRSPACPAAISRKPFSRAAFSTTPRRCSSTNPRRASTPMRGSTSIARSAPRPTRDRLRHQFLRRDGTGGTLRSRARSFRAAG